jgi:hypothetical protein
LLTPVGWTSLLVAALVVCGAALVALAALPR